MLVSLWRTTICYSIFSRQTPPDGVFLREMCCRVLILESETYYYVLQPMEASSFAEMIKRCTRVLDKGSYMLKKQGKVTLFVSYLPPYTLAS